MSISWTKMEELLTRLLEISEDAGEATDGSTTTLEDTGKSWATDMWAEATIHILIGDVEYVSTVSSNTADTLTFTAIGTAVLAGCQYSLKKSINIQDIVRWGGTDLTGRDISLDLKALTDDSIKGLLKSIGDIGAGSNLVTLIDAVKTAVEITDNFISGNRGLVTEDNSAAIKTAVEAAVYRATTPVIYNVTMTNANTEYSQALPANTKKFTAHCRDGTEFRLAFETGKVATPTAPYLTVPGSAGYNEDNIQPSSLTLYVGCGVAGKVVEIVAWS